MRDRRLGAMESERKEEKLESKSGHGRKNDDNTVRNLVLAEEGMVGRKGLSSSRRGGFAGWRTGGATAER